MTRTEYFIAADGARIAYRDEGAGLAVLCLAGLTRNGSDFDLLAPHLPPCRMIRMDYRGRGDSDWTGAQSYTVPTEACDALGLLAHLGVARTAVIGTSRGGIVGMLLAATAPEKIAGLLLNDVGPVLDTVGLDRIRAYLGREPRARSHAAAAEALAATAVGFADVPPGRWEDEARRLWRMTPEGLRNTYDPALRDAFEAAMAGPAIDMWPLFEACARVPIALVRGAGSDLLSAATAAEMARRVPRLRVTEIPGRGHIPWLDEDGSVRAVRDWLAEVERAEAARSPG
jgi:pimeloyl-ACP methyl ester carboxylesterase